MGGTDWNRHWGRGSAEAEATFAAWDGPTAQGALRAVGLPDDGVVVDYESMENRVFGVGDLVVKAYRPGRWSRAGLVEEADFVAELAAEGLPVLPPRALPDGPVGERGGVFFVVLDRVQGDREAMEDPETLEARQVRDFGELLARIHVVGRRRAAHHRMRWEPRTVLAGNMAAIAAAPGVPSASVAALQAIADEAMRKLAGWAPTLQRVHGDIHPGNVLWTAGGPVIMDFDDFMMAPVAHDLGLADYRYGVVGDVALDVPRLRWTSEPALYDAHYAARRRIQELLLEGYHRVAPLDPAVLDRVEALHHMRQFWFDAWLLNRRHDPVFAEDTEGMDGAAYWDLRVQAFGCRVARL